VFRADEAANTFVQIHSIPMPAMVRSLAMKDDLRIVASLADDSLAVLELDGEGHARLAGRAHLDETARSGDGEAIECAPFIDAAGTVWTLSLGDGQGEVWLERYSIDDTGLPTWDGRSRLPAFHLESVDFFAMGIALRIESLAGEQRTEFVLPGQTEPVKLSSFTLPASLRAIGIEGSGVWASADLDKLLNVAPTAEREALYFLDLGTGALDRMVTLEDAARSALPGGTIQAWLGTGSGYALARVASPEGNSEYALVELASARLAGFFPPGPSPLYPVYTKFDGLSASRSIAAISNGVLLVEGETPRRVLDLGEIPVKPIQGFWRDAPVMLRAVGLEPEGILVCVERVPGDYGSHEPDPELAFLGIAGLEALSGDDGAKPSHDALRDLVVAAGGARRARSAARLGSALFIHSEDFLFGIEGSSSPQMAPLEMRGAGRVGASFVIAPLDGPWVLLAYR